MPHGYPLATERWRRHKDGIVVRVEERMWHHDQWWLRCASPGTVRRHNWFTPEESFLARYEFLDREGE